MEIKRINVSEANLVIGLFDKYRVFYKKDSDIDLAERFIKTRLANNESVIVVALKGDRPVGFTQLYPKYSSVNAVKNWILNDLYVESNYRKQGIGEAMIKTAMEFARADGAAYVQLETAVDNYAAQSLYEGLGFQKQEPDTAFFLYRIPV
ncbi:N-acetyltransferase [Mucilaginibacter sp. BT774]|uniref:GNAT family N-acetyltransferase n=1 Tax=Mucilaginibacter sp. BT774 TaxID=3062276 RepID=UPI0026771E05|nr:GNAT family N-acetyltransferase [Mucilaginibacter sp. BT774]MDO3627970.1 GNAT family N-acetyltransferase [Mucilaginibacter sp. BT774]